MTGTYALTITAAAECTALPEVARVRRYVAEIYHASDREIVVVLSGGDFQEGYETFWGLVGDDGHVRLLIASKMANDAWLEEEPIIDRLSESAMVTIGGWTEAPVAIPFTSAALRFTGTVSYCAAAKPAANPWWAATCATPIACRSDQHTIALSRR